MNDGVVRFRCDGATFTAVADAPTTAAALLREVAGRSVPVSCDAGACGACTVVVDGRAATACSLLALQLDDADVETVERPGIGLDEVQTAFAEAEAFQCGFCAPGVVVSVRLLLTTEPMIDEERVRFWLDGHVCRCTGGAALVDVVRILAHRRGLWVA